MAQILGNNTRYLKSSVQNGTDNVIEKQNVKTPSQSDNMA